MTPSEAYYGFFRAIQALEDVFDFVDAQTDRWASSIADFRSRLYEVIDATIERAAVDQDWPTALEGGGFIKLWDDYLSFSTQTIMPFFITGMDG